MMNRRFGRGLVPVCLCASLLAADPPTVAQTPAVAPSRRLSHDQARRDARTLLALLETSHPDPYLPFGGKVAFKRRAQALLAELPQEGLDAQALGDRLRPFLRGLRDGHTFLGDASAQRGDRSPWLPLEFAVAADGLFLAATDLPELAGEVGCKVRGVQGRPLETLLEGTAFQGENRFGDYGALCNILRSRKYLTAVLPGLQELDSVTFNLETPAGARLDRTLPWSRVSAGKSSASWRRPPARWAEFQPSREMFSWRLFAGAQAAYLKVSSMAGRDACEYALRYGLGDARGMMAQHYQRRGQELPGDPEAALKGMPSLLETARELLEEMRRRQIPYLVVDLRGNGGGFTPIVFPLLYLLHGDSAYGHTFKGEFVGVVSTQRLHKRNLTLEDWRKQRGLPDLQMGDYDFPDPEPPRAAEAARREKLAEYRSKGLSWAGPLEALAGRPLWKPKRVLVLCDPDTYSAAFHAAVFFQELGAELVGVPSSQSPNVGMEVTEFQLPESGLKGSISSVAQIFLAEAPAAKVFPLDHPVPWTIYQRYGFDLQTPLRHALDLLAKPGR